MVKIGDKYTCKKTVKMEETGEEAYTLGETYLCEVENCLTDNQGDKKHYVIMDMGKGDDSFLREYFEPFSLGQFFYYIPDKPEREEEIRHYKFPDTGIKESQGKLSYELDFEFITQMAERMDANKGKYEPYNWQKPIDNAGLHRALARHFFQVMRGNYEDEGREFGHLEALALNAMMINYQLKHYREDKELEEKTDKNMNLISAFADHYETETGKQIPENVILSFFNA